MAQSRYGYNQKILSLMQKLGYFTEGMVSGVCHGFTMMALQAIATGDLEAFNQRLSVIRDLPHPTLPDDYQKNLDLMAFFDNLMLHQHPDSDLHAKPVEQFDSDIILPLTASIKLEEQGGIYQAALWPGIYKDKELKKYFLLLNKVAVEKQQAVSFLLAGPNHSIALHYDPVRQSWYKIDVNDLPIEPIAVEDLARWVKNALLESSPYTAFETCMYLPCRAREVAHELQHAIINSQVYCDTHAVTDERAQYETANNTTLAYIAARHGHDDYMEELDVLDADIEVTVNSYSPLHLAVIHNRLEVVRVLSYAGVDLDLQDKLGMTSVCHAADRDLGEMIKELYWSGADINKANIYNRTPIYLAAKHGSANAFKMLLELGANDSLIELAFVAAAGNHVSILKVLAEAEVDFEKRIFTDTLLEIAREYESIACVQFLQDYAAKNSKIKHARLFSNTQSESTQPELNNPETKEPEITAPVKRRAVMN